MAVPTLSPEEAERLWGDGKLVLNTARGMGKSQFAELMLCKWENEGYKTKRDNGVIYAWRDKDTPATETAEAGSW